MPDVINRTEVFCHHCRITHPAQQLLAGGKIIGTVDCPVKPWQTTLSDHGELFLQFRRQAGFDPDFHAPEERPFFFHHVAVTDDCNFRCPVCYADSGPRESNFYLSLAEAEVLARIATTSGARTIILVGGEPTLHPELTELVALFRRAKLAVWLATNGLLIAREPGLAKRLKQAGLSKVSLQLDSFDPETHLSIRGNDFIEEKLTAARQVTAVGLDLGLICTVTSQNLAELASYCRQIWSWTDPPRTVLFQGAAHAGRLRTSEERQITREDIIVSLVEGQAVPGLKYDNFWPIPLFRPLDVYVHPDCAANTAAVVTAKGIETVSAYADMEKFLAMASTTPVSARRGSRRRYLFVLAGQCLQLKGWWLLLRHLYDRIKGGRGARIVFIGTGAFLRRDFHDLSRVQRCGSGALTTNENESLCAYHGKQPCNGV